ncbi:flavodoxin family protein [Actinoplanes sp. CA-252034]|uniref:flavodoxin family protein n=1 Tax=Actinoplanes sp. CA-252034 TaxID=3239906 RepID=UPI003D96257A
MNALVVYESMFGNTEAIARAVAEGLGIGFEVTVADVRAMPVVGDTDLLVVGAPAHAFGVGPYRTRVVATWHGMAKVRVREVGLREYLGCSPWLPQVRAAAFDTNLYKPSLPGSAARMADRRLRVLGCTMVAAAESFHLAGIKGPLVDGELDRARRWAGTLAGTMRPVLPL